MPLPSPRKGEEKSAYVSRFMADKEAQKNFPEEKQRLAVAYSKWEARDKLAAAIAEATMTILPEGWEISAADATHTPSYKLNRRSLEQMNAMVRNGEYVDKPWSFTAEDGNEILGARGDNWEAYKLVHLGIDETIPKDTKAAYAYPFAKGGKLYLSALRDIASRASAQNAADIGDSAGIALKEAEQKEADKATAAAEDLRIAAMPDCNRTVEMTADMNIAAAAMDGGQKGPPTFSMDAYNGGPMRLNGWQHPLVIDLSGINGIDKSRPIFRDHDPGQELGHTTSITTDGKTLHAEGIISGQGPHVDRVVGAARNRFPWQASVGARVIKNEFVPEGKTGKANGRSFDGPVNIARRTSLGEISCLALGADDSTATRIAAQSAKGKPMSFKAWMKARGLSAELTGEQLVAAKAFFKAVNPDVDPDKDDDEDEDEKDAKDKKVAKDDKKDAKGEASLDVKAGEQHQDQFDAAKATEDMIQAQRKAHAAENRRVAKIHVACVGFPDIEAKAVEEGWDETKVELAVLRAQRKPINSIKGIMANVGAGSEPTPDIIAAACAISGGVAEKTALAGLSEQQKNIVMSKEVRKQVGSIYGLCSIVAAAHGMHLPASHMDDDVLRLMISIDRRLELQAAGGMGGFSTMSLSGITENILNKAMLEAYANINSLVPDIAYETDTNDFKTFKRYRLTVSGIMSALGSAGELKNISLQDESYPNTVKTTGVILNVTRDVLLNDDMGALTQAPTLLGRGSALIREIQVFEALLNGVGTTYAPGNTLESSATNLQSFYFFSAGAANYLTGSTSALGVTGMTSAVQKMREQVDVNYMPVMLNPDRIIVPPALEAAGMNLFNGANLVVSSLGSTSSRVVEPDINAHKGKYRVLVSPFMSAAVSANIQKNRSTYPTAVDTAWILLGNPAGGYAPVQVGYLRGQRTPIIERGEANFNTLGISMRCYYDFGVALHDYRTAVYSAGA